MIKPALPNVAMFAAAAIGVAAVGFIAWRATVTPPAALLRPNQTAKIPAAVESPGIAAPVTPGAGQAASTPSAAPSLLPEFDVVRVEPTGETLVAGRAAPQSIVALLSGETKIAEVKADANGQFVIVPQRLSAGDHLLSLRTIGPDGERASAQTVTVAVAAKPGEKTIAVLTAPNKPTVVLGEPSKPASDAAALKVAIRTAEAGEEGAFFATGTAPPGANMRLYLNGAIVANVLAAPDGKWSLKVERGMSTGHYDVRVDVVELSNGKVVARAEVPFDYPARPPTSTSPAQQVATGPASPAPRPPATAASAAPSLQTDLPKSNPAPLPARPGAGDAASPPATAIALAPAAAEVKQAGVAVVREIRAVTVARGDNLWKISRKVLGSGARYTQIYEANASQIRDPNRIFPGQIFVAPQTTIQ